MSRRRRVDGCTPEKQRAFIGHLADTGSVKLAAQYANVCAQSFYRLRRAPDGAAFAAAWEAAIQQAAHALVDAAFERAINGSEEPVWGRDGRVIGRRFRQSDAMMMFLLRKHFPDRYGDVYRDRATPALAATAVPPPPVADTLDRLGPASPYDRDDDAREPAAADEPDTPAGLGPAFEAALEAAKAAADAPLARDSGQRWDEEDLDEDVWLAGDDDDADSDDADDDPDPDTV